jgi:hypothetical protein
MSHTLVANNEADESFSISINSNLFVIFRVRLRFIIVNALALCAVKFAVAVVCAKGSDEDKKQRHCERRK